MTEPENFEDDLFDDLYNDEAPAQSAPSAADPEPSAAPPAAAKDEPTAFKQEDYNDYNQANEGDGGDESHMQGAEEYEDDDDEVDFNLGNGGGASHAMDNDSFDNNSQSGPSHSNRANSKEEGKMFIGGLNWETTDESLQEYFSQFGEVTECTVMRDGATGRSRGFGFLTFKDAKTVNTVMVKEHYLDGKIIDPKRAIPRDEQEKTSKIFVGGVSQDTTDAEFREYFSQFGRVVDATLMMDKDTGRPRGFGFVTFESEAGVDACLATDLAIHGKPIEVKKAQPRGNMREEEEARGRGGGKFGRGKGGMGNNSIDDGSSGGSGMGAGANGMTPQAMARQMQQMQTMFAMMQQRQMQMQGGMGGMNPQAQMMQMMQMQQMQQQMMMAAQQQGGAGRGAGGPGMNPAMMQQMMAQMGQQQPGAGGHQGQVPTGPNQGGYNAYDQNRFNDQGGRRGGYGGGQQGGGYGIGQGVGGAGGQPTSWEGMYDDVPAPNVPVAGPGRGGFVHRGRGGYQNNQHQQSLSPGPTDPTKAPPPNAPTGPKNAGRPGANYRGGGRGGGNRGFHPYGR
ncbi:unnamed protein product [Discula destructiva]